MQKRVLILIGGHLCTAPRAQKEAAALTELGYDVTIAGKWDDETMTDWDLTIASQATYNYHPVLDMRLVKPLSRMLARIEYKLSALLGRFSSASIPPLPAYGLRHLKNYALRFSADLTIAHSEGSLWVAYVLSEQGKMVGVDFEDWFSRDLPQGVRDSSTLETLEKLEKYLTEKAAYLTCPTEAMARAIHESYGGNKPAVILNCFQPENTLSQRNSSQQPRLIWFSQTIGRGRGLETLFQALAGIEKPLHLTLIGRCSESMRSWIQNTFPSQQHSVEIKEALPPWELPGELALHDLGFAIEAADVASTNLTASNKYFQYVASGLAVLGTETSGQLEVWNSDKPPGLLVPAADSEAMKNALLALVSDQELLARSKKAAVAAARQFDPATRIVPELRRLLAVD